MATQKNFVLVVGATGQTGQSIVEGLLDSGNFRVAALVRPSSAGSPATERLRAAGVEIRLGDISDSADQLRVNVEGVDIIVSAVSAWILEQQRELFRVAKDAGVKRVVPGDFAAPGAKCVRVLHDVKLGIHEYIKELGIGYTFIDVGWWMQLYLPLPLRSASPPHLKAMTWEVHGTGEARVLVTDKRHIGKYVARIIADPRTLNHAVMVWEDEVEENTAHELGERLSGEGDELKAKRVPVSGEDLERWRIAARADVEKDPSNVFANLRLTWSDNMYSMHILRENTLENAKQLEHLDARELYPDMPLHTLEQFAEEFYAMAEPGEVYNRAS